MKTILYKTIGLLLMVSTTIGAQNHRRTYNEDFNTNKDVIIDVNTRNTDVKIETWSKNKVSIEAIIEVEGAEDERAERTLDNWKFSAIGNKSEVEITSKSNGVSSNYFFSNDVNNITIKGNVNDLQNFEYSFPELELDNLIALNNDIMVFPESPRLPVMLDFDFHFEDALPKFDYEKYKTDKSYLKKWQKEMEENLEKNKGNWEKEADKIKENSAVLKVELEKMAEEQKKHAEERKEMLKNQMTQRKELLKQRKNQVIIRGNFNKHEADINKKRNIIIGVLEDREKVKVKRTIIIKAPKDAKFKMNVKYGTLSFLN
ncbi:DUF342 domain-containing protein [Aureibaculum algae]|uniref:DUF342 domain-containing protein n=1 Tax=Aureibaculum algae TaxID=2584122 RepID=A0A5B7TSD0_9FLAO|nr:DUF342 domain-containing protein [Aureibaculum algae]QCX38301.1 DUF342 domain-containing protein [Aureibaculum algae]